MTWSYCLHLCLGIRQGVSNIARSYACRVGAAGPIGGHGGTANPSYSSGLKGRQSDRPNKRAWCRSNFHGVALYRIAIPAERAYIYGRHPNPAYLGAPFRSFSVGNNSIVMEVYLVGGY